MSTRVVTFLGAGDKSVCRYEFESFTTEPNRLGVSALIGASSQPCSLIVLGTKKAFEIWPEAKYADELGRVSCFPQQLEMRTIPDGTNDAERWDIFRTVVEALQPTAIAIGKGREDAAPQQIIVDVTHGYRSQPVFATSALAFARSEQRRLRLETPPLLRIAYAAFDARQNEVAPVWELTQLVEVLDWNAAIDGLMRYGRADDLRQLLRGLHRDVAKAAVPPPPLSQLGTAAVELADALVTSRVPHIGRVAANLRKVLHQAREAIELRAPPLAPQLDQLERWCHDLEADTPVSPQGVRAGLRLAQLYARLERYAELAVVLRETIVSALTLAKLDSADVFQPKTSGFRAQRAVMDNGHFADCVQRARKGTQSPIDAVASQLAEVRNDIEHAGYRERPLEAKDVRAQLRTLLETAEPAIEQLMQAMPPPRPPPIFVVCSNHPSAEWSSEQRDTALALGHGPIVDLPFPDIAPESDTNAVRLVAEETADKIIALGARGAFVAGEQSAAFAIVGRLRSFGVPCYVATTHRNATSDLLGDGRVLKSSEFKFVRWRKL